MLCKTFIVPRLAYCIPILNHSKFRLNKCFCFHNMFIILTLDISTSAFTAVRQVPKFPNSTNCSKYSVESDLIHFRV